MQSSNDSLIFDIVNGQDMTDEILKECSKLFSTNYGIWGPQITGREGKNVSMNAARLKAQSLTDPVNTVLTRCKRGNDLIGHAFVSIWKYQPGSHVAWVTQLVVHKAFRRRYIATFLLQALKWHPLFCNKDTKVTAFGLASSHPAAVNSLAKFIHISPERIDLSFIAQNAKNILETSPVQYIRDASSSLRGSLFEQPATPGVVSSVFTDFFVDHKEPLELLQKYVDAGRWSLGDLLDGHEFLIIVPVSESHPPAPA